MAKRPIQTKQLNRLRKALRRKLPRWIDPVDWLRTRGYAGTAGEARRMILDGRLKSESHTVGLETGVDPITGYPVKLVALVKADLRDSLRVETD